MTHMKQWRRKRMPIEPAWWAISATVINGAKVSQWIIFTSGIYCEHEQLTWEGNKALVTFYQQGERKSVPCLLFPQSKLCQIHLLNLLWKYINTLMTSSWLILFRLLPNFLSKVRVYIWSSLHLRLVEMRAAFIVYFFSRFYDSLFSFSWQCVNLYILPIRYTANLRISTLSMFCVSSFLQLP